VSGRCGLGVSTGRHWMARGRQEESGIYRDFLDAVERARSDFLLLANRQLNRLATGGLVRMPAYDKSGSPIRKHREGCDAEPGCGCELVFVEKVLMPNPNVLMWQVDRLDPELSWPLVVCTSRPRCYTAQLSTDMVRSPRLKEFIGFACLGTLNAPGSI
jgi:hypothetical protein